MIKFISKIITILLIAIFVLNIAARTAFAAVEVALDKAYIEKIGEASKHLKYYREDRDVYTYLVCSVVGFYDKDKNFNPAYCMNRNLVGVENEAYYVKVDSLLNNNKVWRVIKNGYPYKSAKQLGLTSKYDAFAVTKFAVYCVLGEAKLEYFKAEKDDEEAVAMLKALKKLVKIGEEGTEKQDADPLSLKKIGGLKEEEKYFSQEYSLTSSTDFDNYEISKTEGMPEGSYIANLDSSKTTKFKQGENFKVFIPKEKMTKDISIKITAKAECKSYVILEGKTTVTKTQNYVVTAGELATATTQDTLKIEVNNAKINIKKVEENTEIPIRGVKFAIYKDEKLLQEKQTDENGKISFENLYPGKYIVKEISTGDKYILDDNQHEIELQYNDTKEITITNKIKTGKIKVYKVDKDNKEVKIEGVKFDIYSEELKKVIGTYTTDQNGEINIENIPIGDYKVIEKESNKWYNLADEIKLKVKYNETAETTITNELKKGQIKVIKVDKDNNEIKLKGVKFEVQDKDGKVLETIETDKDGEAITSKYIIRDYENLYLKEIETNEKYVLNDKITKIKLEENKIKNVVFENEKIKGKIKIIKTSKDYNKMNKKKAESPIEGVKFQILDEKNNVIETLITDKNGVAISSNLEKGEYTVKEVETDKKYILNEQIQKVYIKENKKEVVLNITNDSKNPDIDIEKNGPDKAEIGSKIEYDISIRNTGNTKLDNFTMTDTLPYKYIKINKFKTGTYNQDVKYNLYYKSTLSGDYILLMEDLNSKENYEINFEEELAANEDLIEIKLEFGTVDVGFCSNENPHIFATVKKEVKSESTFTNVASISGNYDEHKVYDKSKWKTFCYKLLPKTGF